jgi:hypothetical protein
VRRLGAGLVVLAALLAGAGVAAAAPGRPAPAVAAPPARPVVVVGVAGLRWDDVTAATPALAGLARTAAVGALSVKAPTAVTCRADGWLTLGAGNRASAYDVRRGPCGSDLPAPDRLAGLAARNARATDEAALGALVDDVGCATTRGPGAALAATTPAGNAPPGSAAAPAGPAGVACPLTFVDAGTVADRDRTADLHAVDAAIAAELAARPPGSVLLVVGLAASPGEDRARLTVALADGLPRGALSSASTRRPEYVQLIDVAPTVLALLGRAPDARMSGQPWRSSGAAPSPATLADLDRRATAQKRVTVPFFVILLAAQLALLAVLRRRLRGVEAVLLAGAAGPAASFLAGLAPWWRAPLPLAALLAVSLAWAALLAGLALVGPWRRRPDGPVVAVCAATALVVAADLLTGGHLQITSVTGYSPLVAGRFAGIGNVAFGVLAAGVLLATAGLAAGRRPRAALAVVAAAGLVTVAVDGAPPWGSDVGGVLALVPGFVLLALLLTGARASLVRLGLAAAAGAAVVVALALADAARPAERRTHLGRFAHQVADGTAGHLLRRKAESVLALLFHSPVTALLPLVVLAAAYLLVRPPAPLERAFRAAPQYRLGLLALSLACGIGFAVNDSGAAVPALALVVVLPATAALVVRVARTS